MGVWTQTKSSSGGDYEIPPEGSQPAVLVALVDLGTQTNSYQGKTTKARKVFIVWELTGERDSGGNPFVIGCDYTFSLNPKANLCKLIERLERKTLGEDEDFDVDKLLGKPCLLSIVRKTSQQGREYAKVDGVSVLPKQMTVGKPTHKPFAWNLADGTDFPAADWLPFVYGERSRDVFYKSEEAKAGAGGGDANEEAFDEFGATK